MTRRPGHVGRSAAAAWVLAPLVGLILAAGPVAVQNAAAEVQVLRRDVEDAPQVSLGVAVDAPAEGFDGSVSPSSFTVAEDGTPRDAEVVRVPADELDVVVLVDNSADAAQTLVTAQGAAVDFALQVPAATRIGVVGVGGEPEILVAPTGKRRRVLAGIGELRRREGTALFDGVTEAVEAFAPDARRRVLVLLSASDDTASAATLDEAAAAVRAADVTLLGVSLGGPGGSETGERLAAAAGGSVTTPASIDQLVGTLDDVARWLTNLYDVSFDAQGRGATTVTVGVEDGALAASTEVALTLPEAPAGGGGAGADDPLGQPGSGQASSPAGEPASSSVVRSLLLVLVALALLGVAAVALRRWGSSGLQAARAVSAGAGKRLSGAGRRARTGAARARGGTGAGLSRARGAVAAGAVRARGGAGAGLSRARAAVAAGTRKARAGRATGMVQFRRGGRRVKTASGRAAAWTGRLATGTGHAATWTGRGIAGLLATAAAAPRRAAESTSAALARRRAQRAAAAPQSIIGPAAGEDTRPPPQTVEMATDTAAPRREVAPEPSRVVLAEGGLRQARRALNRTGATPPRPSDRPPDPRLLTTAEPLAPAFSSGQRASIAAGVSVLESLRGQRLRRVWTPVNRSADAAALVGQVVDDVRAGEAGIVVTFRSGAALQVQLGGGGGWHLYRTGDAWQTQWQNHWRDVSVVLFGPDWTAVCAGAAGCAVQPPASDFFQDGDR